MENNRKISQDNAQNPFHKLINKLTEPKLINICIELSMVIFLTGIIVGHIIASIATGYNMWDNYISDLGSFRYTPAPYILDSIAMTTSVILFPVIVYFSWSLYQETKKEAEGKWKIFFILMKIFIIIGFILLVSASVGFFGIGLFSEDRTTALGLHYFFSVVVFGSFAFASIFNGIVLVSQNRNFQLIYHKYIGIFMFINFFVSILFIVLPPLVSIHFMEWMMLFSLLLWFIPAAIAIRNNLEL
jgi:hypothetical protein